MENSKNIIWLASYPKSGNTWFRAIIAYLYRKGTFDINQLDISPIYSSRIFIEKETGIDTTELTSEEADELRISLFDKPYGTFPTFFKIHDALTFFPDDRPIIPLDKTFATVYFIRNPLDVAVSFAFHSAKTFEKTIENMNNSKFTIAASSKKYNNQLRQLLLSWSEHVKSWTEQSVIPVHTVRYEDMKTDTLQTFKKAIDFIGLEKTELQIKQAIEKSDFAILSQQEKECGFKEKMIKSKSFFRKGEIGDWRNYLDEKMKNEIIKNHNTIMKQFGYLDDFNRLLI